MGGLTVCCVGKEGCTNDSVVVVEMKQTTRGRQQSEGRALNLERDSFTATSLIVQRRNPNY